MNDTWLYEKPIAHRGLHQNGKNGVAENSMTAYKLAIEKGYNIEIDVHLLKDGEFAVFHDSSLQRVCGVDKVIEEMTSDELKNYKLSGTNDTIPTLKEFFDFVDGKVGVLIEIKTIFGWKIGKELNRYIENIGYKGNYAIQSFGPYCLIWYRGHTKNIPIGQLCCRESRILFRFRRIKPDFIAYNVTELNEEKAKKLLKSAPRLLCWTVRTKEEKDFAKKNASNMIFELTDPNE